MRPRLDRFHAIAESAGWIGLQSDRKGLNVSPVAGQGRSFTAIHAVQQRVADGNVTGRLRVRPDAEQQPARLIAHAMVVVAAGRTGVLALIVPDRREKVPGEPELEILRNAIAIEIQGGCLLPTPRRQT
ncbi:MAG TPA: hypothetical protein VF756_00745 [Thermoanaerobaculia bacterium]